MDCEWIRCTQTQPSALLCDGKSTSSSPLYLVVKEGVTSCPWAVGSLLPSDWSGRTLGPLAQGGGTQHVAWQHVGKKMPCSGGCRQPFDVESTVIHEMGHQMRQRSKHSWQKCSHKVGALLNRKITCTPYSQLTPIMCELAFHYGDDWLANVHIGIYSCANACCRDAPVESRARQPTTGCQFPATRRHGNGPSAQVTDVTQQGQMPGEEPKSGASPVLFIPQHTEERPSTIQANHVKHMR